MARELYTGDSVAIEVNVKQDALAVVVDPTSTVTAGLVSQDGKLLAGPWTATAARSGADWAAGKVIVDVVGSSTLALKPQVARLELQVAKSGVVQTRLSRQTITIRRGALPT